MDTNDFLSQLNSLYSGALNFASPAGVGALGNTGTAINTSTAFDTAGAAAVVQQKADYFSAMQGSFNNSFNFANAVFQRNEANLSARNAQIYSLTENFGQQLIDIQKKMAKRASKRGLLSKLF